MSGTTPPPTLELLGAPPHTMLSVSRLCRPFLASFLVTKPTKQDGADTKKQEEDVAPSSDSGLDSADEEEMPPTLSKRQLLLQSQTTKVTKLPPAVRLDLEDKLQPLLNESSDWMSVLLTS
uniref:Uncharacterized protein n=1 Tax=Timema monikensis TaxID=170555 RepID=A0A7R9HRC7_9NEOP|nr:unnamed protein product [Timema monikensis]